MRLTYKYEKSSGYGSARLKNLPNDPFVDKLPYLDDAWQEQRNKLGQLEDIEEELGIDLVTLIRALTDGIYARFYLENGEPNILFNKGCWNYIDKENRCFKSYFSPHPIHLYFKDYGKTWALTKEELL